MDTIHTSFVTRGIVDCPIITRYISLYHLLIPGCCASLTVFGIVSYVCLNCNKAADQISQIFDILAAT